MATATLTEQLTKYLTDAHAIEAQALAQLRTAPDIAGDEELARIFREHLHETQRHEQLVRERLEAHGAQPSTLKESVMAAGGKGFLLFARLQPDTPGKLVAHAHAYEALELAAYELLLRVAERAGDEETADTARRIRDEERAMRDRLASCFDRAAEASLRDVGRDDLEKQLTKYLADAHALEAQGIQLLERGPKIAGDSALARVLAEHLSETQGHQSAVRARLEFRGASPSLVKDLAMRLGGLNWGLFFQAHPDTPGKLAAFAFAFEHLEIAAYEQARRVAERVGDEATVQGCEVILAQERAAAERLAGLFDEVVEASLRAQGLSR